VGVRDPDSALPLFMLCGVWRSALEGYAPDFAPVSPCYVGPAGAP